MLFAFEKAELYDAIFKNAMERYGLPGPAVLGRHPGQPGSACSSSETRQLASSAVAGMRRLLSGRGWSVQRVSNSSRELPSSSRVLWTLVGWPLRATSVGGEP